jgi:hypothetical protein
MSRLVGVKGKTQQKVVADLTEIEKSGRPEDVAAENMSIGTNVIEKKIRLPRASSIYDACMRMHVLATLEKETVTERLGFADRVTFGIGNAIHHWAQNTSWLFPPHMRVGWWRCTACGHVRRFGSWKKTICPKCHAEWPAQIYKEHRVKTKAPYICTGHPDLFIRKEKRVRVVEFKTIASSGYKELVSPKVEHEWQIQFYMWSCSEDEKLPAKVDPNVGYIIYVSKGALWKALPVKMFPVVRSERVLEQIQDKLKIYYDGVKSKTPPEPLEECVEVNFDRGKARQCPMKEQCQEQHQG